MSTFQRSYVVVCDRVVAMTMDLCEMVEDGYFLHQLNMMFEDMQLENPTMLNDYFWFVLWLIHGSIVNVFDIDDVRANLYELAEHFAGYYDPSRSTERAIVLKMGHYVFISFSSKECAWGFDNALQQCLLTLDTTLMPRIVRVEIREPVELQCVKAIDSSSDQDEDVLLDEENLSLVTPLTTEFLYQRIEHERYFPSGCMAERRRLISKEHCHDHPHAFGALDDDPNNRLVLSHELHGFYDACVDIYVQVFRMESADGIFSRLKDGSMPTADPLVMKTFVHVENPETFIRCLKWKYEDIDELWTRSLYTQSDTETD